MTKTRRSTRQREVIEIRALVKAVPRPIDCPAPLYSSVVQTVTRDEDFTQVEVLPFDMAIMAEILK